MNTYFIRTLPQDYNQLLQLGVALGAIELINTEIEEGEQLPVGEPIVIATNGGAWDFIGEIFKPTDEVDEDGNAITQVVADSNGIAYLHINLITPLTLGELARAKAEENPEMAEAISELGKYFVTDADGNPHQPTAPMRVFAS